MVAEVTASPAQMWIPTRICPASDLNGTFLKQTLMIQNEINATYISDDADALDDIVNSRRFNEACIVEIDRRSAHQ